MGIVPDKFILLDIEESISMEKVKRNLRNNDEGAMYEEDDANQIAEDVLSEFRL
jgi:hypothetical protein